MTNPVADQFEEGFLALPLETQIAKCDSYELVGLFDKWLPKHQPVLEAGCGDGRWVAWFMRRGWEAVGLDWSEVLCARAREAVPGTRFVSCDMRAMPFADGEFGSVVSLGAVEHTVEGPEGSLAEFYRVLRPGGIALVTVPYLSAARRLSRLFTKPLRWIKARPMVRQMFGKVGWRGRSLREAQHEAHNGWEADYLCKEDGWCFCTYHLTKRQLHQLVTSAGFSVIEVFAGFREEGLLHNFGGIVGRFDYGRGQVRLSILGRLLRRIMPTNLVGHMLCCVIEKRDT